MILVIDNYDSFVHNLARYFRLEGLETNVVRNDEMGLSEIESLSPQAIIISPGPCTPDEAGLSLEVVERFADRIPMLGICLGHQVIVQALGGRIVPANEPMHGRVSSIQHSGIGIFEDIPIPFEAGRYHSLIAEKSSLPDCLNIAAKSEDFSVMAVEHETLPIFGLQFHPESVLTEFGHRLIQNFLKLVGLEKHPKHQSHIDQ